MSILPIDKFLTGDILLFKVDFNDPNTEWISKAIALLTKSDVSHAALYMGKLAPYNIPGLSDEGLSGLYIHQIESAAQPQPDQELRSICLRRLLVPADKQPIMDAAYHYIKQNEPYDTPALVLLGMILLYRDCPVHLLPAALIGKLLAMAASALDSYIQRHLHPGKKAMVCSQYVFQCYEDAGAPYKLQLQPANAFCSALSDHVYDLLSLQKNNLPVPPAVTEYDETFTKELVNLLLQKNLSAAAPQTVKKILASSVSLQQNLLYFIDRLCVLLSSGSNISLTAAEKSKLIKDNKALFVTPADLKNCTNLADIGDSEIYRSSSNFISCDTMV